MELIHKINERWGGGRPARQSKARQRKATQGKARQGKARQGKERQGRARHDKARQGRARQGRAKVGGKTRAMKKLGVGDIICINIDIASFGSVDGSASVSAVLHQASRVNGCC